MGVSRPALFLAKVGLTRRFNDLSPPLERNGPRFLGKGMDVAEARPAPTLSDDDGAQSLSVKHAVKHSEL
jgi:hypothetical protein